MGKNKSINIGNKYGHFIFIKTIKLLTFILITLIWLSCNKKDEVISDKAELLKLVLENIGSTYTVAIYGTDLSLTEKLPYGTTAVKVKDILVSDGAISSVSAGGIIPVTGSGIDITVTAKNQIIRKVYHLSLSVAPSDKAELLDLVISFGKTNYQTVIDGFNVTADKEFAYNISGNAKITSFIISENAKATITNNQEFNINDVVPIRVEAEDGTTSNTYSFSFKKDTLGKLLFEHSTYSSCVKYNTHRFGELMLENNLWNADGLDPSSFSQCIYRYQNGASRLLGWKWSFTKDQKGVNAYPVIIYGLQPWYSGSRSTTTNLPRKISEISRLVVDYHSKRHVDDGEYNLAFQNWICSSSGASPGSILFEFMVWEDYQNLTPFGNYKGEIMTTNGKYKLYKGEPNWEPSGCNWTYLAFVRVEKRNSGKVSIDELLKYLVNQNIVSSENYLVSIGLGNEVGNSTGYTVFENYNVEIE